MFIAQHEPHMNFYPLVQTWCQSAAHCQYFVHPTTDPGKIRVVLAKGSKSAQLTFTLSPLEVSIAGSVPQTYQGASTPEILVQTWVAKISSSL